MHSSNSLSPSKAAQARGTPSSSAIPPQSGHPTLRFSINDEPDEGDKGRSHTHGTSQRGYAHTYTHTQARGEAALYPEGQKPADRGGKGRGCCHWSRMHTWYLAVSLVATVVVNLAFTMGGFLAVGGAYNANPNTNILTPSATAGLFVFLVGVGAGPATIGLALVFAGMNRKRIGRVGVALVALALAGGCIGAVVAACVGPLQANIVFRAVPLLDSLQQLEAGFIIVVYSATAVACLWVAIAQVFACGRSAYEALPDAGAGEDDRREFERDVQPVDLSHRWKGVLLLLFVMGLAFFCTIVFSPVFNYSSTSYFNATSPYSLLPADAILRFTLPTDNNPSDVWRPGALVLKMYEDVLVYFAVIIGLAIVGVVSSAVIGLQRVLHKRIPVPLPAYANTWPLGITVGELGVVSSVLALYAYWFWFWSHGYERIRDEAYLMGEQHVGLHVYARVLGHMTTLTMSFMVLPITRNSVWEAAFGIPFERAIKYHRLLGRLTWIFVTLHMLLWYIKWLMEGTLGNNIVTIDNLIIASPYTDDTEGNAVHADNFTIPLVETGWAILTFALVFAQFFRRTHYDLFHLTHHAVWIFFLTALVHAWSHWYYMAGGLTLYLFDKLTRVINASREASVLSITHAAGITRIVVKADIFRNGGHFAGQYAFLHIPAISPLAWHPFTISSAPAEAQERNVVTFHIRNMGPRTWTESLAKLALERPIPSDLALSVDGPYGHAGHYAERDTVILVAGGIGITPMHAILQDLHARACNPLKFGPPGVVRKVHLIWVSREHNLLTIHADTFANILRHNPQNMFVLHVYCTGGARRMHGKDPLPAENEETAVALLADVPDDEKGGASHNLEPCDAGFCDPASASMMLPIIMPGRPNMRALFDQVAQEAYYEHHAVGGPANYVLSDLVSALVCGPQTLIEEVSTLAMQHGMDFHSEVFHF